MLVFVTKHLLSMTHITRVSTPIVVWLFAVTLMQGQQKQQLIRLEPTFDHPIVFRGEVFIEQNKRTPAERQNRNNWYARGRYLVDCGAPLLETADYNALADVEDVATLKGADRNAHKRLMDAVKRFSKARIAKATHRIHAKEKRQQYIVTFAEPEPVAEVERALREANIGDVVFLDDWTMVTGVPTDGVFEHRASTANLYATRADDQFYHHAYNERTRAWSLYSAKVPMAWDVTTGTSDVVVGIVDQMNTCKPSPTTTDVAERTVANSTGNVRRVVSSTTATYSGLPQNTGNGIDKSTYPVKTGHGYSVLGAMLARANNGVTTPTPSGSAVGTCPDCNGVVFPLNPPPTFYTDDPCNTPAPNAIDGVRDNSLTYDIDQFDDFDLDFTNDTNGTIKRLDILNCSYVGGNGELHKRLLRNGVAIVAAAGNDFGTAPFDPAATVVLHQNPALDTKILAVGSISDGEELDANCNPWKVPYVMSPVWKGAEQFTKGFVFSPGAAKFSRAATMDREMDKRNAYMDVVAPGGNVWTLYEKTGVGADSRGYTFQSGTSLSTALVSGIVGLMFSVNPDMGVAVDSITDLPATIDDGLNVQRRMYNIVTFTAKKVADLNVNYGYAVQGNDALLRSWSQRMGFGKIDAYRAVAHSIPHKGAYEYTESTTLEFNNAVCSPSGIRLMHWGSRIKDGLDWPLTAARGGTVADDGIVDVLSFGGRSLPNENHNNCGVTRITNAVSQVVLSVPDSSALCIDGMVLNEGSDHQHTLQTSGSHSRILIDGLVRNVKFVGALRMGDLIADGSGAGSVIVVTEEGDLYGRLSLEQRSTAEITGATGTLRVRPGACIRTAGARNVTVKEGGTLVMDHASSAIRTGQQEIDIHADGTLRVIAGASVNLDTRIRVRRGGSVVIEDSSITFIRDLFVEPGGTITIRPGAHLSFGQPIITINGRFVCEGGSTERTRITLSARIGDNCRFGSKEHARMSARVKLRGLGSAADWRSSRVSLRNTDCKNVGFSLTNVETLPVENCSFSMHRSLPSTSADLGWINEPWMFAAYLTERPTDASPYYLYTSVLNSTFTDSAGPVAIPFYNAPFNQSMNRYVFSGILAHGYERSDVTGCKFSFLRECVTGFKNAYTTVNQCTLTNNDLGVRCEQTTPRVCDNNITTTEYPVSLFTCEKSYHNDNRILQSRVAVRVVNSAMQAFRGNEIAEYWRGIVANYAAAALTTLKEAEPPFEIQMYGRNRFDVSNPALFAFAPANHPNPFMRRFDAALYALDVARHADLGADEGGGVFLVKCGENRFSAFATSHVAYLMPSAQVIDFGINNCRPNAAVRVLNVGANGAPLNVDGVADKACGPLPTDDWCSQQTWRDGRDEVTVSEGLKRPVPHNEESTANATAFPAPRAVSLSTARNLLEVLRGTIAGAYTATDVRIRSLTGEISEPSIGTFSVELIENENVVARILVLITP